MRRRSSCAPTARRSSTIPAGIGKPENQGFDAFIPLIDSGISLYVWSKPRFFAAVLFTCKRFGVARALDFTRAHFGAAEVEHREF